ncbi:autotransporter outer membrane beta-barrel domain-containing protein [Buttiauxella sp. WJP83]|uniref:autotransporter outer membrane beta-barrel domain-containing protein n=1 Tax=Buttiauxella sp. WJP83 TaxID=2986951 RepID=UPI0022DCE6AB|nr:autotransporter outer membrane beta-barrel domain-containing protein [Buttiauxella sp. WJP83]WBM72222.1 autotransporter outer membrane beta-barrel domain-containing protein [Buttiauxella sp. WJP83]
MNKFLYRLIFNKARGMLMAVPEYASSCSCRSDQMTTEAVASKNVPGTTSSRSLKKTLIAQAIAVGLLVPLPTYASTSVSLLPLAIDLAEDNNLVVAQGVTKDMNDGSTQTYGEVTVDGTLNITEGSDLVSGVVDGAKTYNAIIGDAAGTSGTVNVSGDGSSWIHNEDFITVGSYGSGQLNVSNGGYVESGYLSIGNYDGSSGTVNVSGSGSELKVLDNIYLGRRGGASNNGEGGEGVLNITEGAIVTAGGTYVGYEGTGTVNISGGSTLTNGDGAIGHQSGSSGTVNVTDGSTWNNTGYLLIGHEGQDETAGLDAAEGVLNVSGGSTVSSTSLYVGDGGTGVVNLSDGSQLITTNTDPNGFSSLGWNDSNYTQSDGSGTVNVDDSTWTNQGNLIVGQSGYGELNITNSGQVSAVKLSVGHGSTSTGVINISGGSQLTTDSAQLGLDQGASGTVTVSGADSSWNNANELMIGRNGQGMLNILDGGAVTTGSATVGSNGTLTIDSDSSLVVDNAFTMNEGATLNVMLDANASGPLITADSATLDGNLVFEGFAAGDTIMTSSSATTHEFVLIDTDNTINGDFDNQSTPTDDGIDYLVSKGYLSEDGTDYNLGFKLAWTDGGAQQGTGTFTLAEGTAFDVDVVLADQDKSVTYASGWDGKSLTKEGDGLLVLSAANTYTGGTTVNGGTLQLSGEGTLGDINNTTTVTNGTLDLGGTTQTQATLNQSGGTVQSGTMNVGTYQLTGGTLATDATVYASTYDFQSGTVNGQIQGGDVTKTTDGTVTLAGSGSSVDSVDVQQGTLVFVQNESADASQIATFSTTGNYTTQSGATTDVGQGGSTLNVGGDLVQEEGSTLAVTLNDDAPVVNVTGTATLDGEIAISGFAVEQDGELVSSSELTGKSYGIIHADGGITPGAEISGVPDYLIGSTALSSDNKDYSVSFDLAWDSGSSGSFTVEEGTGFEVDTVLADQSGETSESWDGKSLTKSGEGILVLSAENTYTGATTVTGGVLRTDVENAFSSSSEVSVTGGVLDLNGYDQQVNDMSVAQDGQVQLNGADLTADTLTLAGDISFGAPVGPAVMTDSTLTEGRTITVNNWVGEGGSVELYTVFGGDDSVSDKIVIDGGTATGDTGLVIRHGGGEGAQTDQGILVVDAINGATTDDAFYLSSESDGYRSGYDSIAAGAYDYQLVQGGNGGEADDWYLTSSGSDSGDMTHYRPEVGAYLNNKHIVSKLQTHTMHDRQTPGIAVDAPESEGVWVRIAGGGTERTGAGGQELSESYSLIHGGGDFLSISDGGDGVFRAGAMGQYASSRNDSKNQEGITADGEVSGYSVGLYGTWYGQADGRTGPYVDTWLMYGQFDNEVKGQGLDSENYDSEDLSVSLEAGYAFQVGEQTFLEPQAQIIHSNYQSDTYTEHTGTVVSDMSDKTTTTRLGVRLSHDLTEGNMQLKLYSEANWWHGPGSQSMTFDGVTVQDDLPDDRFEAKFGVQGQINKSVSVWGTVGLEAGSEDYRAGTALVGVRYTW